jgi:hypothetical protein
LKNNHADTAASSAVVELSDWSVRSGSNSIQMKCAAHSVRLPKAIPNAEVTFSPQKTALNRRFPGRELVAGAACAFLATGMSARADVFSNVPSAADCEIALRPFNDCEQPKPTHMRKYI